MVGEVAKRMDLNDNDRLGFREEFSDNVYVPIETVWAKVFDYYYRGYDGSNMYSRLLLRLETTIRFLPWPNCSMKFSKRIMG